MSCSTIGSATANDGCNLLAARPIASLSAVPARIIVLTFPQCSLPRLLTAAACGGLGSTPGCRTRRTSLHLSYSCVMPCGPATPVTQDPMRTLTASTPAPGASVSTVVSRDVTACDNAMAMCRASGSPPPRSVRHPHNGSPSSSISAMRARCLIKSTEGSDLCCFRPRNRQCRRPTLSIPYGSSAASKHLVQHSHGMHRLPVDAVVYLMPAGRAIGHDQIVRCRRS